MFKSVLKAARFALFPLFYLVISNSATAQINPSNIDIVRDKWGVPHIYGKTDADAAYGLAWATCEDDFADVQKLLLAVRGRLAEVDGKGGAVLDFLSFIGASQETANAAYDTAFSPEYKKVIEGYRDGLNAYAAANPHEVLRKGLFPVTGKDIIAEYVLTNMLLTNVYLDIQKIFLGSIKNYETNFPSGSNTLVFDSSKTTDGKTYLAINSHQPLEGLFSWYEAHINSEEGLNILGGTFPGGMSIFLGTNTHLGWACTLNHPDLDDVYKLDMNPKNKLQYWFDDHWETLQVRKRTVKVKLGAIRIPITKTFYWSKYGTTIKGKTGFYSVRFPANMDVRCSEQLYKMNKAQNFTQWHNAMEMNTMPGINFMYADCSDTIFYVSAGQFPYRSPKYDWTGVLPGNTSETLWQPKFHPFDSIPQILKPKSGYMLNTNNTPFDATTPTSNLKMKDYDVTYGFVNDRDNRSIMAHHLISKYDRLSYEDFKHVKYNQQFNDSMYTYNLDNISVLMNLSEKKYPELADAIGVIKQWDFNTNPENTNAALLSFALYHVIDKVTARGTSYEPNSFTEKEYVEALRSAKKHMLRYFGSLQVPLGDVQKHVRGNVVLPIGGAPDVLAATISQPYKKGMRRTFVGESYIQLVRYSHGKVEIESVNAYGASAKPDSPHYTDQMQMFVDQKLKPMTLDKDSIYKNADKIYHPVKGDANGTNKALTQN